ncbi:DUF5518 domain-containing protein [Natrinema halophilum]|uniref:DUF5518 domain-containing protein n=1 Tax=Natrinema halophilum TaxID=1699371 RepID=A0A7D5KSY5_9EURY|nr:DUF5518 domain-containing protein [Natrinema halophilum]QLG50877.1 DUF5518 domain-containing protein [Natrinema halophilum]
MTHQHSSLWADIINSISSGHFSSAVLWGTLVGCFASIVEYNVSAMGTEPYSVRYGILLGGIVAGFLYASSWRDAVKAGGYAGAIPVIVLAPLVYFFLMVELTPTIQVDGGVLLWTIGSSIIIYPATVFIGMILGAIGGFIGYSLASAVSYTPWSV